MFRFELGTRRALLISFALAFFVRLIPELLAYPHPIGYDSVIYAWIVQRGVIWSHWSSVFSNWLLYALWIPIHNVTQGDPFLLVKLTGPLLYGLSACGVYWFSSRGLRWEAGKSFLVASVFVFQLAAFRISWDLLRNTFGMALLLFALPFLLKLESRKDFAGFIFLSVLVTFTHNLVSVVMFVVVFGFVLRAFLEDDKAGLWRVSAAVLPSLAIFLLGMYVELFPVRPIAESNVTFGFEPVPSPAGLFFLANYFVGSASGFYSGYFDLASHVFSVFAVLYLLALPLVFVGFFRDRVFDVWTVFIVCAAFSCLVMPFFALNWWERWLFLLVYPFTFYVANGVHKVFNSAKDVVRPSFGWLRWMRVSKVTAVALVAGMVLLTSVYIGATLQNDNYLVFSAPTISRYFAVAPLVPLRDVDSTVEVLKWVDGNMGIGSCVLVHHALFSWALLYLDDSRNVVVTSSDLEEGLDVAFSKGFDPVYLVWWGESIGWYGVTVPNTFSPVFESGRMAAFQYLS